MAFKELMEIERLKLNNIKEPKQHSELFRRVQEEYIKEVQSLIEQLNKSQDAQRSDVLKQIKETDQLYLEIKGIQITGHVLFSRHGKCRSWEQKKFGLSPNAALSEEAEKNMGGTSQSTGDLLFYSPSEHPPSIAVSPMNRALQTAGLVIPKEIKNATIAVLPFLAENSNAPSGYDVRSLADMQKLSDQISFWMSPIKKLLLKLSLWIYSDQDFALLNKKRKNAAEKIQEHGNKILLEGLDDVCQDLDYDGDKIEDTQIFIGNVEQRDCWLFGHGKNFKAFFQTVLGITLDFDYGETRRVYKVEDENHKSSLFVPPYVMLIDQETGKIKGEFTGVIGSSLQKESEALSKKELCPKISKAISSLGGSVVTQEIQQENALHDPTNIGLQPDSKIQYLESEPLIAKKP
ncbi:histidine phosphatase family protein [Legionella qingyii]|uniref:histidine phosphatase family protein n=1 Tax=Legionella qingyii TaxID=2184757 RepID=UPI000F8C51EA|nr:histidine phosphatase family protein [Legionella qingyii]RUR27428.1 histidine phosphatase family protein [Legionella qingyii]